MKQALAVALMMMASASVRADRIPEMARFFSEQLTAMDAGVCSLDDAAATENQWYLRRFWLRVRPKFSFKVPGLTSLEIVPELELLWQRDLPEGWKSYKPIANALF